VSVACQNLTKLVFKWVRKILQETRFFPVEVAPRAGLEPALDVG